MTVQLGESLRARRLVSVLELMDHADFIYEGLNAIHESTDEHNPDEVFQLLRQYVRGSDFGFWVQFRGTRPVAFVTIFFTLDIYGTKEAAAWLLYCRPEADRERLWESAVPWLLSNGVATVSTVTGRSKREKLKRRWLERAGFKLRYWSYQRKIYGHRRT